MNTYEKALILDFGGVISRTMFETHRHTEIALGLPKGTLNWMGPFDLDGDELWQAMQCDEISEREYWLQRTREVGELVGQKWSTMQQFVRAARGADTKSIIRPEAVSIINVVKKAGRKLALLSNELDLFYGPGFRNKLPFLAEFDVIIDATYSDILKPDMRAYIDCGRKLNCTTEECVFVDDQARNILGAQEVGMQTVLFDVAKPADSFRQALLLLGLTESEERHA